MANSPYQGLGPLGSFQHSSWKEWINSTETARQARVWNQDRVRHTWEKGWIGKENRGFRGQQAGLPFKERHRMKAEFSPNSRWAETNTDASLSPQRKTQPGPSPPQYQGYLRGRNDLVLPKSVSEPEENLMMPWHETTKNKARIPSSSHRIAEGSCSLNLLGHVSEHLGDNIPKYFWGKWIQTWDYLGVQKNWQQRRVLRQPCFLWSQMQ